MPVGMRPSPFTDKTQWLGETPLAFSMVNFFPSTPGHVMVLPRDFAVYRFFELAKDELLEHHKFAKHLRPEFNRHFSPDGYNIGWNVGFEGGQSIAHAHMHIMPRYDSINAASDINPLGGISRLPFSALPSYYEGQKNPDPVLMEKVYEDFSIFAENEHAVAVQLNKSMAVSPGHIYILPKSKAPDFFTASSEEILSQLELVATVMNMQAGSNNPPQGYNLGWDVGTAAGQTLPCAYLHVIPRYKGDMDVPRGGIVKIIPEKAWPMKTDYYEAKNIGKDVPIQEKVEFPFSFWTSDRRDNILKFE